MVTDINADWDESNRDNRIDINWSFSKDVTNNPGNGGYESNINETMVITVYLVTEGSSNKDEDTKREKD